MRVLWLTCTPAGASKIVNQGPPTRGWIASLADLIKESNNINLAIAFFDNYKEDFKFEYDGITYYPMRDKLATRMGQFTTRSVGKLWDTNPHAVLRAISDFKPDIIQIFGTESGMGDIIGKTQIPIIIHLQGLINAINSNWLPKGISLQSVFFRSHIKKLAMRRDLLSDFFMFKKLAMREEHVIKNSRYFFGRTAWDKNVAQLFNPNIEYFHCDEVLRPFIYKHCGKWQSRPTSVLKIVTIINPQMYKGLDIVLKTAEILKSKTQLKFEWTIIGVKENDRIIKMMESRKCLFKNYPIIFKGVKHEQDIVSELLHSDLFIHPSHIDNSPNSVCEAMIVGMPVIAGYVGGVPSLIQNGFNGILYNSYDPFELAGLIVHSLDNRIELQRIGRNAAASALKRHDRSKIVDTIKKTYQHMLSENPVTNPLQS